LSLILLPHRPRSTPSLFSLQSPPPPTPTLFPYTTLFRSFLGVLPGLTVGRPESRRPSIRAPEARPAAPVAPLQKGRSLLVGSGWSPLPRPGRGSERRARVVLDRHPCRLRPAA